MRRARACWRGASPPWSKTVPGGEFSGKLKLLPPQDRNGSLTQQTLSALREDRWNVLSSKGTGRLRLQRSVHFDGEVCPVLRLHFLHEVAHVTFTVLSHMFNS